MPGETYQEILCESFSIVHPPATLAECASRSQSPLDASRGVVPGRALSAWPQTESPLNDTPRNSTASVFPSQPAPSLFYICGSAERERACDEETAEAPPVSVQQAEC